MRLRRSEVWAIALTAVFLAAAVGWQMGMRHRVPAFSVSTAADADTVRALPVSTMAETPGAETPVNINTADVETLKTLSGIGDALAARIVEYREEHGPFQRVEEITRVSGVGMKTLETNLDRLTVGIEEDEAA